jgi:hypothetical protein
MFIRVTNWLPAIILDNLVPEDGLCDLKAIMLAVTNGLFLAGFA